MLTRSATLALLKVLITAAWADSRLSHSELNYLKHLAQHFRLNDADWLELEAYLEAPVPEHEREGLVRDLMARIATPFEREVVIRHIEQIIAANEEVTAEERRLLAEYTAILREASTLDLIVGRLRGLFSRREAPALDIDEFVRNKVLFKLKRRSGGASFGPEMHRLALLGGLMGTVARADGEIHEKELAEIRRQLEARGSFDGDSLELLMAVIEEESIRGLDRARLIAEYSADLNTGQRVDALNLLFAVAAADGKLTHAELEELRGISAALGLSHRQYIASKISVTPQSIQSPLPQGGGT